MDTWDTLGWEDDAEDNGLAPGSPTQNTQLSPELTTTTTAQVVTTHDGKPSEKPGSINPEKSDDMDAGEEAGGADAISAWYSIEDDEPSIEQNAPITPVEPTKPEPPKKKSPWAVLAEVQATRSGTPPTASDKVTPKSTPASGSRSKYSYSSDDEEPALEIDLGDQKDEDMDQVERSPALSEKKRSRSNSPALGRSPERERTLSLERVASPPLVTPPHEGGGGFEVLPDMNDSDLDYDPEKPGESHHNDTRPLNELDTGEPTPNESSKQQSDKERPETPQKSVRFKSLSKDSDEKPESSTLYKGLEESQKSPKKSDAKKPSTDSPRIENPFAFVPRTVTGKAEPAGVTRTIDAAEPTDVELKRKESSASVMGPELPPKEGKSEEKSDRSDRRRDKKKDKKRSKYDTRSSSESEDEKKYSYKPKRDSKSGDRGSTSKVIRMPLEDDASKGDRAAATEEKRSRGSDGKRDSRGSRTSRKVEVIGGKGDPSKIDKLFGNDKRSDSRDRRRSRSRDRTGGFDKNMKIKLNAPKDDSEAGVLRTLSKIVDDKAKERARTSRSRDRSRRDRSRSNDRSKSRRDEKRSRSKDKKHRDPSPLSKKAPEGFKNFKTTISNDKKKSSSIFDKFTLDAGKSVSDEEKEKDGKSMDRYNKKKKDKRRLSDEMEDEAMREEERYGKSGRRKDKREDEKPGKKDRFDREERKRRDKDRERAYGNEGRYYDYDDPRRRHRSDESDPRKIETVWMKQFQNMNFNPALPPPMGNIDPRGTNPFMAGMIFAQQQMGTRAVQPGALPFPGVIPITERDRRKRGDMFGGHSPPQLKGNKRYHERMGYSPESTRRYHRDRAERDRKAKPDIRLDHGPHGPELPPDVYGKEKKKKKDKGAKGLEMNDDLYDDFFLSEEGKRAVKKKKKKEKTKEKESLHMVVDETVPKAFREYSPEPRRVIKQVVDSPAKGRKSSKWTKFSEKEPKEKSSREERKRAKSGDDKPRGYKWGQDPLHKKEESSREKKEHKSKRRSHSPVAEATEAKRKPKKEESKTKRHEVVLEAPVENVQANIMPVIPQLTPFTLPPKPMPFQLPGVLPPGALPPLPPNPTLMSNGPPLLRERPPLIVNPDIPTPTLPDNTKRSRPSRFGPDIVEIGSIPAPEKSQAPAMKSLPPLPPSGKPPPLPPSGTAFGKRVDDKVPVNHVAPQKQEPVDSKMEADDRKLTLSELSKSLGLSASLKGIDDKKQPPNIPPISLTLGNNNRNKPAAHVPPMPNVNHRKPSPPAVRTHHSPPASPTYAPPAHIRSRHNSDRKPQAKMSHLPQPENSVLDMFAKVEQEMKAPKKNQPPVGTAKPIQNALQQQKLTQEPINLAPSDTSFSSLSGSDFDFPAEREREEKREKKLTKKSSKPSSKAKKVAKAKGVDTKCEAVAKDFLKPYFAQKKITKEQYKNIMRRTVGRYIRHPNTFTREHCRDIVVHYCNKYIQFNMTRNKKISHSKSKSKKSSKSRKDRSETGGHLKVKDDPMDRKKPARISSRKDMYALLAGEKSKAPETSRRTRVPPPPPPEDELSSDISF